MKHRLPLVFVISLILSACGGGDSENDRAETVGEVSTSVTTQTAESKPPESKIDKPLTQDQINRALLVVSDLPEGFTVSAEPPDDENEDPLGCEPIDRIDSYDKGGSANGEVSFQQNEFLPGVQESIVALPGTAKQRYDEVAAAIEQCASFDSPLPDGGKMPVTLTPLDLAKLADGTLAFKLTMTTNLGPIVVDFVFIRAGENLILLTHSTLGATDENVTRSLAAKCVEKLNNVA